jgi:ABC-type transporter Mla subunit MlaD
MTDTAKQSERLNDAAEMMFRNVNRHADLIAALKEADDFISASFENLSNGDAGEATGVLKTIRAALKEAQS